MAQSTQTRNIPAKDTGSPRSKQSVPWLHTKSARQKQARTLRGRSKDKYVRKQRRGRKEPQHRRVLRVALGLTELPPGTNPHHINEIKNDNRVENLQLVVRPEHAAIHGQLTRWRRGVTSVMILERKNKRGYIRRRTYKFKTKPYAYQVAALRQMLKNKGGGLFMDMGTGKTKVAIDFAGAMHLKEGVKRVLVICPKSVIPVWRMEIPKHLPAKLVGEIEFLVTNYDKIADKITVEGETMPGILGKIKAWEPDLVILDEAHKVKNPSAARTKAIWDLGRNARFRLILTGTPVTKNPLDTFAQFKFVDDGLLGNSFSQFKRRYAVWGGYGGHKLLRYINMQDFNDKVKDHIFVIKKEDCLDLPNKTHQIVPVELSTNSRKLYQQMAKDALVKIKGHEIEAPIVLTKLLRLSQITGGWMKVPDKKTYLHVGKDKETKCLELLEEMREQERQKVVIFCRFTPEVTAAARVAKRAGYRPILFHGGVSESKREQKLADFDECDDPACMVVQIATGALGISLVAASEAIFWSHTYNYGEFQQACDRLHRIGQHHPVTYYHLIVENSIDEVVWLALKGKKRVAELVFKDPQLLMEEGYNA